MLIIAPARAEDAIVECNTIFPIIGMLESSSEKIRVAASNLLANLSTNKTIRLVKIFPLFIFERFKMRNVAWVAPLLLALRNVTELKTKQGILRAIVNFSMDSMWSKKKTLNLVTAYCRAMLLYFRADDVLRMLGRIESIDKSVRAVCVATLKRYHLSDINLFFLVWRLDLFQTKSWIK